MITIMKSSDVGFQPHLALCHMTFNGGSANEENIPLVIKSKQEGEGITQVLKELGEDVGIIEKASYRNIQRMLESAIRESFKPEEDDEYVYIWLQDFDETTAVFDYKEKSYAISYTINEAGIVLLGSDFKEVVRQDVYVSTEGDALVLKSVEAEEDTIQDPAVNTEEITDEGGKSSDSSQKEEEKTMTDKVELSVEELEAQIQKAAEDAIVKAKAEWEAEAKHAEVVKSTTEIVKGLSFIQEEDAEAVVKAMVILDEDMLHIVKAFTAASEKIAQVEAEKEEIKKEFGAQSTVEVKPEEVKDDLASILKANVAKAKANK